MSGRISSPRWSADSTPGEQARLRRLLYRLRSEAPASVDGLNLGAQEEEKWALGLAALRSGRELRQQQLDEILTAVYRLAARDFSYRLPERGGDDTSDYIAVGLNMLAEALEESTVSRRHLDSILDTMIDPLLVVGKNGVSHCNAAAERELGLKLDDLRGQTLENLMQLDDAQRTPLTYDRLRAACKKGAVVDVRVRLCGEDGRQAIASVNAGSLGQAEDDTGEVVLVVRDMTEINGLVEAARAGGRVQSDFVATVGHEMRTPMHGVIATTSMMLEGPLNPEQRHQLGVIQRSAETLVALVDDLLDHAKLDARRMQLAESEFSPVELAKDVVSLLSSKARAAGLDFDLVLDSPADARVVGDPHRLRQVLTNLCGNAIKFTDQGGVQLRVILRPAAPGHVSVRLEVVDTGIGIPEAQQSAVFEPFVQADNTQTRRHGGTGLGLSISRHLVQLMGAELHCESEPGRGSRFWFDLDLRSAKVATPNPPRIEPRPSWKTKRVLVAEDNAINRSLLVSMLELLGVPADAVADGQAAIEAVERRHYDLVLMDWEMPNIGGASAALSIRSLPQRVHYLPIVCMTGRPDHGQGASFRTSGMDDLLPKPFRLGQLHAMLSRFLDATPPR